jgi:hypothetical protein
MKVRLTHPLWTHIPAVAALAILIGALVAAGSLPGSAPLHFGSSGEPDSYGSPWTVFALIFGISVGFIAISVWLDELWTRQEARKSFNYFALLDDVVVSAMVAQGLGYLSLVERGGTTYSQPLQELLLVMAPTIAVALILERLRPFTGRQQLPLTEDTSQMRREVARTLRSGSPFAYIDIQNPAYVTLLSIGLPALFFVSTALQFALQPVWVNVLMMVLGVLLASFYGGIRTVVTREHIAVHFGTPGYRVLRLQPAEIAEAVLHNFMPLKDFGGYGIRVNRSMKAYYLSGGTGVLLTTREGKKHLIGSNHPERLATVIREVAGLQPTH